MEKELTTPVLFLIFNRPDTTQRVFNKIQKAKPAKLFIAADGPRPDRRVENEKCEEVRRIIDKGVDWDCKIHKLYRDQNLGCKIAVSSAIDWFFENVEEGIILEDDCLPDQSFFQFCEKMLEKHRNDTRIMMISGTNYLFNKVEINESYFFSRYYAIWGWATWRRAWKKFDIHMNNWNEFRNNKQLTWIFSDQNIVKFYVNMFQMAYSNKIDTWDIFWVYSCIFQNALAIVPQKNLVSNIGVTGTHTGTKVSIFMNMPVESIDTNSIKHPAFVTPNMLCDKSTYFNILMNENKLKTIISFFVKQIRVNYCIKLICRRLKDKGYMKEFMKKYLPFSLLNILSSVYNTRLKRPIINYFKTHHKKNVLISYIIYPFRRGITLAHTNHMEALEIAKVFDQLSYNVDIVDFDDGNNIDYSKYDIIFGFGEPLINSFYHRNHKILTIYYGTGTHVIHQNHATLKRIAEVYKKRGKWLLESGRIVNKAWSVQTSLVDNIILFGNEEVITSYRKHFSRRIYNIPVSYYKIFDHEEILKNKEFSGAKYHFLWFGSSGLIHKGLDLLLEVFKELSDLHLHICGPIDTEPKFKACYYEELYNTENIHTYGYVNLKSETFRNVINQCAFVVMPSCSEGEPSSVINVMVYGLIPIVPSTAGIRIKDFGIEIKRLTHKSVRESIIQATNLSIGEIEKRSLECANDTIANHSIEKFSSELKKALIDILRRLDEL